MSTRSSVYYSDPAGGPKIHVFWEHMTDRYEMEVCQDGWSVTVPVSQRFAEALSDVKDQMELPL